MPIPIEITDGTNPSELEALREAIAPIVPKAKPDPMVSTLALEEHFQVPDDALADLPLQIPDMADAIAHICGDGLFDEDTVRDAISSLLVGHLMLSGPPGTGKTFLARQLARAFNVRLVEATANPEWTVYDLIGSLTLGSAGNPKPKHGHVTKAILDCYEQIAIHDADNSAPQAVWILIDEVNRCEIDRAFGGLFTALSGDIESKYTLDYLNDRPSIRVPRRFKIIAPLNSFDTRFVNGMSAALKRRFSRIPILPPKLSSEKLGEGEFNYCLDQAIKKSEQTLTDIDISQSVQEVRDHADAICSVLGALRGNPDEIRLPIGPAQVIDSLQYTIALLTTYYKSWADKSTLAVIDNALSVRLTSALESDRTRLTITPDFLTKLDKDFGWLVKVRQRLRAFHSGLE